MGRRSSSGGGRSSRRPASRPAATTPSKPDKHAPPPATTAAPTATPTQGFVGMMADGFFWSTGSSLAHRAVEAVVGPRTVRIETAPAPAPAPAQSASSMAGSDACSTHNKAFQDCLNGSDSDISKCQFYMDMLVSCRKNSGSMM